VKVERLDAARFDAWARLFERAGSACFCRYWHFTGTKNDWLARSLTDANKDDARAHLPTGLVAIEGDEVLGWTKLAPRSSLVKLRAQSVYRALDLGADDGVIAIGCMLVDPAKRASGVARALVQGAIRDARDRGALALEAYPRCVRDHDRHVPRHAEELWMGPEALYLEAGFVPVAGEAPYLVYRLQLRP
jgi:GNAT superfamily N-acetyltransferase